MQIPVGLTGCFPACYLSEQRSRRRFGAVRPDSLGTGQGGVKGCFRGGGRNRGPEAAAEASPRELARGRCNAG